MHVHTSRGRDRNLHVAQLLLHASSLWRLTTQYTGFGYQSITAILCRDRGSKSEFQVSATLLCKAVHGDNYSLHTIGLFCFLHKTPHFIGEEWKHNFMMVNHTLSTGLINNTLQLVCWQQLLCNYFWWHLCIFAPHLGVTFNNQTDGSVVWENMGRPYCILPESLPNFHLALSMGHVPIMKCLFADCLHTIDADGRVNLECILRRCEDTVVALGVILCGMCSDSRIIKYENMSAILMLTIFYSWTRGQHKDT